MCVRPDEWADGHAAGWKPVSISNPRKRQESFFDGMST